ncbi:MAG: hypothetical protein RLZZ546_1196 [Bacteroidota bacterium]|jgi:hypothetical protein
MIIEQFKKESLNDLLEALAESLDITQTQYENAVISYREVSEYLTNENSPISKYSPIIRPQGSFLLGTVIKAVNDEDDIDIDLVISLNSKNPKWTQFNLKNEIGNYLKKSDRYNKLLDKEGKRCWTLKYREDSDSKMKYHMDVLPSIISSQYFERLLASKNLEEFKNLSVNYTDITLNNYSIDDNINNWPITNPFGFAKWFYSIATISNDETLRYFKLSIEEVPSYLSKKLILQMIVQILKRHRDIMFKGDEDKPISIIITTLAGYAYKKENNIYDALTNIVNAMENHINEYNPIKFIKEDYIGNPLNPKENFADKWKTIPKKKENFYLWINRLKSDIEELRNTEGLENYEKLLNRSFGEKISKDTLERFGKQVTYNREKGLGKFSIGAGITSLGNKKYSDHTYYGKK